MVGEAVTRKLGPFPVWMWAIIIAGSYLVWKLVHGGGSSTTTYIPVGTGSVGGSTGTDTGTGSNIGEQGPAGETGAQGPAGAAGAQGAQGKPGVFPSAIFQTYTNLLTKLTNLIKQRGANELLIAQAQDSLMRDGARYVDGIINKSTYEADKKLWTDKLNAALATQTSLDKQITDTQTALNKTAVGTGGTS